MQIRDEIVARVDRLPPALQEQVLRYVASLEAAPKGEPGTALLPFVGLLDHASAQEMLRHRGRVRASRCQRLVDSCSTPTL